MGIPPPPPHRPSALHLVNPTILCSFQHSRRSISNLSMQLFLFECYIWVLHQFAGTHSNTPRGKGAQLVRVNQVSCPRIWISGPRLHPSLNLILGKSFYFPQQTNTQTAGNASPYKYNNLFNTYFLIFLLIPFLTPRADMSPLFWTTMFALFLLYSRLLPWTVRLISRKLC